MRELQFISDRMEDIQREIGVSGFSGFLEEATRKAQYIIEADFLCTDVYFHSVSPDEIQKSRQFLENEFHRSQHLRFYYFTEKKPKPVRVFKDIFSSIAIVFYDSCLHNDPDLKNIIVNNADQYNLIFLVDYLEDHESCKEFSKEFPHGVKSVILSGVHATNKSLPELFEISTIQPATQSTLKKIAYCKSIKPLFVFLQDIFESENKTIQTRKLLNSQASQISKKEEQGINQNDLATHIRQVIQKVTQELDKNFKSKYEELNKPNIGLFSKSAQDNSSELKSFNKIDIAEKSEKVGISIDKKLTDNFLEQIKILITVETSRDEPYLKMAIDEMLAKINVQLMQKGIAPVKTEEVMAPFPSQHKLIQSYCYLSKVYWGELTKKGATEYFIALRDYIGIMMVATGLLAPLNLIASLSDEHSMFGFLKRLSTGIKIATALLTILLIIYGIFDLRKRIPRKREEEFEKELNKGREFLFQDGKRMFSESSRDWSTAISSWIRDTMQNISNQIERNIKDLQNARSLKMLSDKNKQLLTQQSIDMIQRNLMSAEKTKDIMATRFRDLVLETEKELKF